MRTLLAETCVLLCRLFNRISRGLWNSIKYLDTRLYFPLIILIGENIIVKDFFHLCDLSCKLAQSEEYLRFRSKGSRLEFRPSNFLVQLKKIFFILINIIEGKNQAHESSKVFCNFNRLEILTLLSFNLYMMIRKKLNLQNAS